MGLGNYATLGDVEKVVFIIDFEVKNICWQYCRQSLTDKLVNKYICVSVINLLCFGHLRVIEGQVLSVSIGDAPIVAGLHRSFVDDNRDQAILLVEE